MKAAAKKYRGIITAAALIFCALAAAWHMGGGAKRTEAAAGTAAASPPTGIQTAAELSGQASESEAGERIDALDSTPAPNIATDLQAGQDKYLTDPVPAGKPLPVEPQEASVKETAYTCTLSVVCGTILDNIDRLDKEKLELVPEDGLIFPPTTVTFYEGESVFNVLHREMKRNKIHFEFVNTPIYNSAYIEGIHNLYEFDCGELSGWMYKVNGWYPNYGCSRYALQDGDVVEWIYTCDLGRDIGGFVAAGGQP